MDSKGHRMYLLNVPDKFWTTLFQQSLYSEQQNHTKDFFFFSVVKRGQPVSGAAQLILDEAVKSLPVELTFNQNNFGLFQSAVL